MRVFLKNQSSERASPVPMDVFARDVTLTPTLMATVERRLAYALGRLGASIRLVQIRLSDGGAPRAEDKVCEIRIVVTWKEALTVSASGTRMEIAITKAAHVAARRLDDLCKRRHSYAH